MSQEEIVLQDAAWRSNGKRVWERDIENYRAVAEALGCSVSEAMQLQMLSFLFGLRDDLNVLTAFVRDFHMQQFPEKWTPPEP